MASSESIASVRPSGVNDRLASFWRGKDRRYCLARAGIAPHSSLLPALTIRRLISSMPRRCQTIIDATGVRPLLTFRIPKNMNFTVCRMKRPFTRPAVETVYESFGKSFSFSVILIERRYLPNSLNCVYILFFE